MAEIGINLKGILAQFDELDKKLKSLPKTEKPFSPPLALGPIARVVAFGQLASIVPHIAAFAKVQAASEEWVYKLAALMDVDPGKVEKFIEDSYSVKRPVVDDDLSRLIDRKYTEELTLQVDLFNRVSEFIFRYYSTGSGLPTLQEVERIWKFNDR